MQENKNQQLHRTFHESYIFRNDILSIKGSSETTLSLNFCVMYQSGIESNTNKQVSTASSQFFCFKFIRDKLYYKRISTDKSYSIRGQILMHEDNYQ